MPEMIQGVVIQTDGDIYVRDFGEPLYKTIGAAVGGHIEVVRPEGLPNPFFMLINEEGRLQNLPFNPLASYWYGTQNHGQPIVGTAVILKEALNEEQERDWFGLTPSEIDALKAFIAAAKHAGLPEEPKNAPLVTRVYSFDSPEEFERWLVRMAQN